MAIVRSLPNGYSEGDTSWRDDPVYVTSDKRMLRFERLSNRGSGNSNLLLIFRAKVPGGWLVVMRPNDSITFLPDPTHEWDGASLP